MDFAKHIFEIIFANVGWKVEEMTKAVKDLLNELYDAYSAMCSSSTPSMCSESVPSDNYGGTSYSSYFTTEVGFRRFLVVMVMTFSEFLALSLGMLRKCLFRMRARA